MLAFSNAVTAADLSKEVAECAAIQGDLARLECYDNLAAANGLSGPQVKSPPITGKGKWNVEIETNPIDDSRTVTLLLKADSGQSTWGKPIYLVVRCMRNKTEMFISWQDYLTDEATVLTRIGSKDAQTSDWNVSTDQEATFYPGNTTTFLKNMMAADKLVAQVTPYNESPTTAIFETGGMENAIQPLRETCGW